MSSLTDKRYVDSCVPTPDGDGKITLDISKNDDRSIKVLNAKIWSAPITTVAPTTPAPAIDGRLDFLDEAKAAEGGMATWIIVMIVIGLFFSLKSWFLLDGSYGRKQIFSSQRTKFELIYANGFAGKQEQSSSYGQSTSVSVNSVKIFVKYINCRYLASFRLTSSKVLDLLQIARIFHVESIIDSIAKYLVSTIGPKFDSVLMLNLRVITSDWSLALNQNLRSTIYTVAANNFVQLFRSATFPKIPFSLIALLFTRCDLNVTDEYEVATMILHWLEFASRSEEQCIALARTIRSGLLTEKQRKEICLRLSISPKAGQNFSNIFEEILNSPRNQRICMIDDHITAGFKRCGIPEWSKDFDVIPGIKIKINQKIQEEKDVVFIDKSRPVPCIHPSDGLLTDEPSEYLMKFWADYWKDDENTTCNCTCHQANKKKNKTTTSPKKRKDSRELPKRSPSRRKFKKTSTKSDSVLLSGGKFPHLHAPKPSKETSNESP